MHCRDFREMADSYLGDELLVETNHDVIRHLENCAACRRELAARRNLRATLRASFARAADLQMSDEFAGRLRNDLRATALRKASRHSLVARRSAWLAIAACLLIVGAFGLREINRRLHEQKSPAQVANTNHQPLNSNLPRAPERASPSTGATEAVGVAISELYESAVGDHRDCALDHRLAESPIDLKEAAHRYDPAYLNLAKIVMSQLGDFPGQIELVAAHSCVLEDRRFGHVILKHQGQLVSVLVTDLGQSKTSVGAGTPTGTIEPITCSQLKGFQVACFETARHAVLVVSDLPEEQNLTIARALASSVYEHLKRFESTV